MKKIILFLILILLVGCQQKKVVVNDETLLTTSKQVIDLLIKQDNKVKDLLSSEFKSSIPADVLLKIYKEYTKGLNFIDKEDSFVYKNNCVYNFLRFNEKMVKTYMCFDQNLKVSSFVINDLSQHPELVNNEIYEEIAIKIGKKPSLNGILTLPKKVEKPKVVIMSQGSGPSDLNETIYENKPFEDIARGLATYGIASIRFDKRTYAYPESIDIKNATVDEEYLYDLSSAIHNVNNYPVDPFNIYFLGHSQGGMLAFYLLHLHPEVNGAIILGSTLRGLEEVIIDQNKNALTAQGYSEEAMSIALSELEKSKEKILSLSNESEYEEILGIGSPYWYSLKKLKIDNFEEIKGKYLILHGDKDQHVFLEKDFGAFKTLFENNKNVVLKNYENLNHLFMYSSTGDISEYKNKSHVDDQVIIDMAKWLNGEDIFEKTKGVKK